MGVLPKGGLLPTLIVAFGLSGLPVLAEAFLCIRELLHGEFVPISLRGASVRAVSASGSVLAAPWGEDAPAACSLCWAQLPKQKLEPFVW